MASSTLRLHLLLAFFLFSILLINVKSDEEDTLFEGINNYRKSLNLNVLTKNDNAECFAEEVADQIKNQPCTNSTGSFTVPGTEQPIDNYEALLSKCHLNISNTRAGNLLPACVPNLEQNLVLGNFTQTLYSGSLNDTKYTGVGIGSDGNWVVVVLTTNTPEGSYVTYNAASLRTELGLVSHILFPLMALFLLALN
ncbi:uncharacterized GPI-anchored protein At3g06035-like [Euphorbia lathyris]|uniref:uncharacterized GPI-anchored protein At3g06035-like n=1 Tax=Euphorbia lathyris TaxID=212925 RepID=UPI0033136DCE